MVSRKRTRDEMEMHEPGLKPNPPAQTTLLDRIRNMWEFASFMQFAFTFGEVVLKQNIDIEEFEDLLLQPDSAPKLADLALTLLKWFSSHRPLNLETFDEVTRRQYKMKAPNTRNPFGYDEVANKFVDFDVITKLKVIWRLSSWVMYQNPDKLRERMGEDDQTTWRVEELGWDADDRTYYLLDDNRLYRRTDAPLPPEPAAAKSKSKSKKAKGSRSSKRRRVSKTVIESSTEEEETKPAEESELLDTGKPTEEEEEDGFGGMQWELVAITLDEYNAFIDTIRRSRDANEKILRNRLTEDALPIIEKRAEQLRQKELKRLRDLENIQKLATAKRSSRLAVKAEQRKADEEAEEAERKRASDLVMAKKEQEKQRKLNEGRKSRMQTREQRIKDRETKRILHEDELRRLEEEKEKIQSNAVRGSERQIKNELERHRDELNEIEDEEDWTFDCSVCGVYGQNGQNIDDGADIIECEKCQVWQHSACHGISQKQAERDDFHFICGDCKRKALAAKEAKIPPIKLNFSGSSPKTVQDPPAGPRHPADHSQSRPLVGVFVSQTPQLNGYVPSANGLQTLPPLADFAPHERPFSNGSPHGNTPVPKGYQWQPLQTATHPINTDSTSQPSDTLSRPPSSHAASPPAIGTINHHRPHSQHSAQSPPSASWPAYLSPSNGVQAPRHSNGPSQSNSSAQTLQHPQLAPLANGHGPSADQPQFSKPAMTPLSSSSTLPKPPYSYASQQYTAAVTPGAGEQLKPFSNPFTAMPGSAGSQGVHSSYLPGFSPAKQISPGPPSSHSFSGTPIIPPVTTLSPSVSVTPSMSRPVKKATPAQPPPSTGGGLPEQQATPSQPPVTLAPPA